MQFAGTGPREGSRANRLSAEEEEESRIGKKGEEARGEGRG